MGLLDQLWDETLAGPRPDSGLSKLRKSSSFSRFSWSSSSPVAANDTPPAPAMTRSTTMTALSVDTSPLGESYGSSGPESPASTLDSPFASAITPKGEGWRNFRRKPKVADGPETVFAPRSPTVYDWVVISSLDQ
ncbi:hypothetical protein EJB05_48830 [Eragrostis curvula]|uniref:Auxin-repressed protein n=1 Tax=Eragrostis curvula TaxID=38414 RepID=A0A5J9T2S2_9POAL|nr:hypothetical protein EJB05_48830 [Eragrostis curvula]